MTATRSQLLWGEFLEVERRFEDSARRQWRWWRMCSDDGDAKPVSLGESARRQRRSWRVWSCDNGCGLLLLSRFFDVVRVVFFLCLPIFGEFFVVAVRFGGLWSCCGVLWLLSSSVVLPLSVFYVRGVVVFAAPVAGFAAVGFVCFCFPCVVVLLGLQAF
ncbi:hypothetical protein Q3G72_025874 [Acer saccharum]|nr:hypothetical protein Q3G72_025874 [Acer saccharum]